MANDPAPLFVFWEGLTGELLERSQKLPKAQRFTFAQRIDNLALDILELLAGAQWSAGRRRRDKLQEADERLLRLRVLIRLAHNRRLIDHGGYEYLARQLDEAGRMLGGWLKYSASSQPSAVTETP